MAERTPQYVLRKTGIDALDRLLGGGVNNGPVLQAGDVVLIRGAAGSGKTTLGLKLLAGFLEPAAAPKDQKRPEYPQDRRACFASLEQDPAVSLWRSIEMDVPMAQVIDREQRKGQFIVLNGDEFQQSLKWSERDRRLRFECARVPPSSTMFFIDSLSAMVELVMPRCKTLENERRTLVEVAESFRRIATELKSIIIFSDEYRPGGNTFGQSFLCDTEILLTTEPISGAVRTDDEQRPGVGYVYDRNQETKWENPHAVEIRSFCRVLKSRGSASHSRRCAYDLVPGKGIVFHETYPGDGHIVVFAENQPQRDRWEEFIKKDVPGFYPALRYDQFDRSGMQRTFAAIRRFMDMPSRTDLHLSSFDTYWVKAYAELRRSLAKGRKETLGDPAWGSGLLAPIDAKCLRLYDRPWGEGDATPASASGGPKQSPSGGGGDGGAIRPPLPTLLEGVMPSARIPTANGGFMKDQLRSVPYVANAGLLVYRKDMLADLKLGPDVRKALVEKADKLRECQADSQGVSAANWADFIDKRLAKIKAWQTGGNLEDDLIFWEEIIAICRDNHRQCLVETRTFDTYLVTLLEMIWGCNGNFKVSENFDPAAIDAVDTVNLNTKNEGIDADAVRYALGLLSDMMRDTTPRDSSVEPTYVAKRDRWMFARHWYSTLVELVTAKQDDQFIFGSGQVKPQLGILPVPATYYALDAELELTDGKLKDKRGPKRSCAGEWHFGILSGSENLELGINLINNLMTRHKIVERALCGAGLPTVKGFYEKYGPVPCLPAYVRDDLVLPNASFADIKEKVLDRTRSRSEIYDYRRVAGIVHSVLERLRAGDITIHAPSSVQDNIIGPIQRLRPAFQIWGSESA